MPKTSEPSRRHRPSKGVLLLRSFLRWLRADGPGPAPTPPAGPPPAFGGRERRLHIPESLPAFLASSPVPTVIVGLDHRLVAWNPAFVALTGDSPEGLEGRTIDDLVDDAGQAWLRRQLRTDHGPLGGAQFGRVRLATGCEAELLITGCPFRDEDGIAGWQLQFNGDPDLAFADPSIQTLVERVRGEKERLSALLTVSHAVINSLDLDIILATIAQEVRHVIEVDECTVFLIDDDGETLTPVVCDAERFRDQMMRMRLRVGEGITGSVAQTGRGEIVNTPEDDPRAAHVPGTPPEESSLMCVPMIARERVLGVITLARLGTRRFDEADLELATLFAGQCSTALANARIYDELRRAYDELREAQSQLVQSAKLNALGEMAAGVAHDFNNILAAILGRTQIMLREAGDPALTRQLLVVQQAALDGAQSVHRVQEFTRIRQDERFAGLDVNRLLADVVELTRTAWETDSKKHGIRVRMNTQFRATRHVAGNASELREVFTNMILNAVDAMPEGGDLFVSSDDAGDEVMVRVRDTGIGMDQGTRERVFDPFFTTKAKGTGLGLSIAYGIVTRHRGTIRVESEPGQGTEFDVRFPCSDAAAARSPSPPAGPPPAQRVLVVDDEEPVRTVLADMLRELGQEVFLATGGHAGIGQVDAVAPDIVFSDLGMPEVNGWDVAEAVRARRPGAVMVLVTGWASQIESDSWQSRGVDIILPKPFLMDDVERVMLEATALLARRQDAA